MTIPKQNPQSSIQGEPLPLDELLDIATIDDADIESAAEWWDEHASDLFAGALDVKPTKGNKVSNGLTDKS